MMGYLEMSDIDIIIKQMDEIGELSTETADEMLNAGADIVKDCWQRSLDQVADIRTGKLRRSIKKTKVTTDSAGAKSIKVSPSGQHEGNKSNSFVARVLNYAHHNARQNGFVERAEAEAEPKIEAKYEEIWQKKLSKLEE